MRRIEAYGVVCELGCIADACGQMPEALKSPAEWRFFQYGLDRADVTILGRLSHEAAPNPKLRRRLVVTGRVRASEPAGPVTVLWNPAGGGLEGALALFGLPDAHLAVAGGANVFAHFLSGPHRCSAFHLSRMSGVRLEGGRGVFPGVPSELSPEAVLSNAAYTPGPAIRLDARAEVTTWTPQSK